MISKNCFCKRAIYQIVRLVLAAVSANGLSFVSLCICSALLCIHSTDVVLCLMLCSMLLCNKYDFVKQDLQQINVLLLLLLLLAHLYLSLYSIDCIYLDTKCTYTYKDKLKYTTSNEGK